MQHEYQRTLNRSSPPFPIEFSIGPSRLTRSLALCEKLPIFRLKAAVACGNRLKMIADERSAAETSRRPTDHTEQLALHSGQQRADQS